MNHPHESSSPPRIIVTQDPMRSFRHFELTVHCTSSQPSIDEIERIEHQVKEHFETDVIYDSSAMPPRDVYMMFNDETRRYERHGDTRYKVRIRAKASQNMDNASLTRALVSFPNAFSHMIIDGRPNAFRFLLQPHDFVHTHVLSKIDRNAPSISIPVELHNHTSGPYIPLPVHIAHVTTFRDKTYPAYLTADWAPPPITVDMPPGGQETIHLTWRI